MWEHQRVAGGDRLLLRCHRDEHDPALGGDENRSNAFVYGDEPVRRRVQGVPAFAVKRGVQYGLMPDLRVLRWLAELARLK